MSKTKKDFEVSIRRPCEDCDGTGRLVKHYGPSTVETWCPPCGGTGTIVEWKDFRSLLWHVKGEGESI